MTRCIALLLSLFCFTGVAVAQSHSDSEPLSTVRTLITTPLVIEGLTSDDAGALYTTGRNPGNGNPCPVYRIPMANPTIGTVGTIPAPSATTQCSPSGIAFGPDGRLYVSQGSSIYRLGPNTPTEVFTASVPGTNGLAFDKRGNLWTGDGTTGQGRIFKVTPAGVVTEEFRVQPMANEIAGGVNVGRDVRTLPPGTITVTPTSRNALNAEGSQPLVANGLAFDHLGNLFIADTARGAIWRVRFTSNGNPVIRTGCDITFTANTLCLDHVVVAHPYLEGVDGIALDVAGNIWAAANERNAIAFVSAESGTVIDVFRNPVDRSTMLRNAGPLETPTSPVLVGNRVCTANSDGNRRDNFPSTAGEIGGTNQPRGKISCIQERVNIPGLPLPVF